MSSPPSPIPESAVTLEAPRDPRLAPVLSALDDPGVTVLSVDVFDTVVWRAVPEPDDLFAVLGARLAREGRLTRGVTALGFARLRRDAEERARDRRREAGAGVEVTLEEIWAQMPAHVFAPGPPAELAEVELELEREMLRPDLDVVALLRLARQGGRRVVALSDTYFSEAQLRRVALSRAPLSPELFDRVLVSSAFRHGKATGMFSRMLTELGVTPAEVVHLGDHPGADVEAGRASGVRTVHFDRRPAGLEHALRYEAAFGAGLDPDHGDHGLTALRARLLARSAVDEPDVALRPFHRWGAGHVGPALWGFAQWVVERAAELGVHRVNCLMREGELLTRLVELAGEGRPAAPAAERLWISRQVLARASIYAGTREEIGGLVRRRRAPTVRELGATLGIDVEAVDRLAPHAGARLNDPGMRSWVIGMIAEDVELRAAIVAASAELRERVLRHVLDRVGGGSRDVVVVDVGWAATIQGELQRLLDDAGADVRLHGLYLITHYLASPRILDGVRAEAYLANLGDPALAVDTIARSPELLEQVCMPDHGTQVGFQPNGEPALAPDPGDVVQHGQRRAAQQGVLAFANHWRRYQAEVGGGLPPLTAGAAPRLLAMTVRALAAPTLEEAEAFGGWLHEDNFGSDDHTAITSGPAARLLAHMEPKGLVSLSTSDLYWPYGLAAIHDVDLGRALALVSMGLIDLDAFSSNSDTGAFEVTPDLGYGYLGELKSRMRTRRNRRGLSYVRGMVHGGRIQRIRIDPAEVASVVRIDSLNIRCWVEGRAEPELLRFEAPADFAVFERLWCDELAPKVYVSTGDDPQLHLDLTQYFDAPVYFVDVECAFASVALPVLLDRPEVPAAVDRVRAVYSHHDKLPAPDARQLLRDARALVRRRLVARLRRRAASD